MTTNELLASLSELDCEIDSTVTKFEQDTTATRSTLNERFADADKALEDFVEEISITSDLTPVSETEEDLTK